MKIPDKILIVRLSSFGDIVLTYPLISRLKEVNPLLKVDFITKDEYAQLISANKNVNSFFTFGKNSISDLRKVIKENKYDLIIDLQNNIRSNLLRLFQRGKVVRYKKKNLKKFLLVLFKINLYKEIIPVYKKYILTVKKIFSDIDTDFIISDLKRKSTEKQNYILLCPTSKHFTKTYPKEKFREITKKYPDRTFYLVSGDNPAEKEICSFIARDNQNVKDLSGKTDYKMLMELIGNSELVICNDSGILHLSEAIGKRVIAIFGSTVREFGFYPQLKDSVVIENKNLKCRPCSRAGKDKCPKKHFRCMNDLKINLDEYLS
jgi:heptosyltransferase-2